jgi:proteasome lid subunit RPN8/RPN11
MTLYLRPDQQGEIRRQATSAWPAECCGLLAGRTVGADRFVERVTRLENEESGSRGSGFRISPEALLRAESGVRREGLEILGFYHSHPDGPPHPSRLDLERAWPAWSCVIVAARGEAAGEITAWTPARDRSRFITEEIVEETP